MAGAASQGVEPVDHPLAGLWPVGVGGALEKHQVNAVLVSAMPRHGSSSRVAVVWLSWSVSSSFVHVARSPPAKWRRSSMVAVARAARRSRFFGAVALQAVALSSASASRSVSRSLATVASRSAAIGEQLQQPHRNHVLDRELLGNAAYCHDRLPMRRRYVRPVPGARNVIRGPEPLPWTLHQRPPTLPPRPRRAE